MGQLANNMLIKCNQNCRDESLNRPAHLFEIPLNDIKKCN